MSAIEVLYEDNHLIAVNKKVSDLAQGDATGDDPLSAKVAGYLKEKYNKPGNVFVGTAHRLDRPVSGVMLFARTSKALSRLNQMFKDKEELSKTYWAIVQNAPAQPQSLLTNYLRKDSKKNKSFICKADDAGGKEACLQYKLLGQSENYFLLEVKLLTGRHHQIRAQLAHIGCPIKGDLKYGAPRSNPDGGISLHARCLQFTHPVTKLPVEIVAPVPNDNLWHYFENKPEPKNN
jgi:23S rRNA pseudouridine1911/1915/1917 synthase